MGKKRSEKADDNLREFKVGDRVKVNMHRGRIVEAEVKAVVEKTPGVRLQVSFGNETLDKGKANVEEFARELRLKLSAEESWGDNEENLTTEIAGTA